MNKELLFLCLAPLLASCTSTASSIPDPHNHVVDVHEKPWSSSDTHNIKLVLVERPPDSKKANIVLNQSKTLRAYVTRKASGEGAGLDLIWIEYVQSGQTYEIQGIPLPHRPFSDLKWVKDKFLVFDRWSNPHYGMHYVLDTVERKVRLAAPFPDQFFLDSQRRKSKGN